MTGRQGTSSRASGFSWQGFSWCLPILLPFGEGLAKTPNDKDGDGSLDLRELSASKVANPNKLFNEIDTNKDGKITYKEFLGAATKWFKVSDMNRDGFLDRSEFNALRDPSSIGLFLGFHF